MKLQYVTVPQFVDGFHGDEAPAAASASHTGIPSHLARCPVGDGLSQCGQATGQATE